MADSYRQTCGKPESSCRQHLHFQGTPVSPFVSQLASVRLPVCPILRRGIHSHSAHHHSHRKHSSQHSLAVSMEHGSSLCSNCPYPIHCSIISTYCNALRCQIQSHPGVHAARPWIARRVRCPHMFRPAPATSSMPSCFVVVASSRNFAIPRALSLTSRSVFRASGEPIAASPMAGFCLYFRMNCSRPWLM